MSTTRVFNTGLFLVSFFFSLTSYGFQTDVSDSPSSDLILTLRAIRSAKESLFINAYELTSQEIADAIAERIESGIHVEILQEGQPVGGFSKPSQKIQEQLLEAMMQVSHRQTDQYFVMTSKTGRASKRRYRFDHAKYMIIDNERLLIGSENYSPTGNPEPGAKKSTRGWETLIHDSTTAKNFRSVFSTDKDASHGDILQLVDAGKRTFLAAPVFTWNAGFSSLARQALRPINDSPLTMDADSVESVMSPDTSLKGLTSFIGNARKTLAIQLMTFAPEWGNTGNQSPLIAAVLKVARKGVEVRVLLNDEDSFPGDADKNEETVDILNKAAKKEGLNLEAAIANLKGMGVNYIHNKGALADGNKTLVSSINWNQNSVENNREAALAITSEEIHDHYRSLFNGDWEVSKK